MIFILLIMDSFNLGFYIFRRFFFRFFVFVLFFVLLASMSFDSLPFHASVLEPNFNLSFAEIQIYGDLVTSQPRKVVVTVEFVFELPYLILRKCGSFFTGFWGCCCRNCWIWRSKIKNNLKLQTPWKTKSTYSAK